MRLSDFDFTLPEALVAQAPAHPRDHARLLVYDRSTGRISDHIFHELPGLLAEGTTLVMNNSKVEKARLLKGNQEVFVTRVVNPDTVEALVRPGRHFRPGKTVDWGDGIRFETLSVAEDGLRRLRCSVPMDSARLDPYRHTPFPPYIAADESLADEYQTVYAKPEGSKAAPTAGLHFTQDLLERLREGGVPMAEVTLHVGLGTFAPVKTDDVAGHRMHAEWFALDAPTAAILNTATHITAVGTTTTRVLESAAMDGRRFVAGSGETDIFITPGYAWKATDALITNFHLPKSTLLMLVAAMTGLDEWRRIYDHAVRQGYRFYSFGDAMLIR